MNGTTGLPASAEGEPTLRRSSQEINAELTPGLIHDVNNVLTGIFFHLETARELVDGGHPLAEILSEMQVGIERIRDLLDRATRIHLNAAEREVCYHDLESLAASQADLLRILFPKTTHLDVATCSETVHIKCAEHTFRTALLALAVSVRGFFGALKSRIPLVVWGPVELRRRFDQAGFGGLDDHAAVGFQLPGVIACAGEVDEYLERRGTSDISMVKVELLAGELQGALLFIPGPESTTFCLISLPVEHLTP